jgi:hypothetical protein
MAFQSKERYRSAANGDRWSLIRDSQSGRVFIEHEANVSSGGQTSRALKVMQIATGAEEDVEKGDRRAGARGLRESLCT